MNDYCNNCLHNEICRYGAYCPSKHCNDKLTMGDIVLSLANAEGSKSLIYDGPLIYDGRLIKEAHNDS